MAIRLSDRERRLVALFEDETGTDVHDCVASDDLVVFVVAPGDMGRAIGPGGRTVRQIERRIGRSIRLVEDADTPEALVANALAPAAVYGVTIDGDDRVAVADVAPEDLGAAIGRNGTTIAVARLLAERHYDLADVQLADRDKPGG